MRRDKVIVGIEPDVQRLVVESVHSIPLRVSTCSHWTDEHLHVVRSHGLGPWLYQWLTLHPEAGARPEFLDSLRQDHRTSMVQGVMREALLHSLLPAFQGAGIPLVLLKGCYLARFVYAEPALRPMEDVDVLVTEQDWSSAKELLSELGFQSVTRGLSAYHSIFKPALPFYRSGPHHEHLDLHWALQSMDYYRFPSDAVRRETSETILHDCPVSFLSPEANFLHLGLHALNHAHSVRNWLDLALMAKRSNLDWERCVDLARRLGAMRPMYWVLQELSSDWRIELPSDTLSSVESYRPHWIEDKVIRHPLRRYWRGFARLERLPDWKGRLHYIMSLSVARLFRSNP